MMVCRTAANGHGKRHTKQEELRNVGTNNSLWSGNADLASNTLVGVRNGYSATNYAVVIRWDSDVGVGRVKVSFRIL